MATISHAAVAASVVIGLVSIPSASMAATSGSTASADIPDVSDSEEVPKEVSRSTSSDGFEASVKTAFKEFKTEVNHDSMESSLENPGSRLEVEKKPSETEWKLVTSRGTLKISSSGETVEEVAETPLGTLEITREGGEKTVRFEGSKRSEVEERYNQMRQKMEERKQELEERRQELERSGVPNVRVVANESTASGFGDNEDEHVVLVNSDINSVDLDGWKLSDEATSYEMPSLTLKPGEKVKVYSSQEWHGFEGTGISWNDGGDTATLENNEGVKVDETSY